MAHRKQINANMDKLLSEETVAPIEPELIDEYKKLNEKCDSVITKIKTRKAKTASKK
jgi:hypothetical protein